MTLALAWWQWLLLITGGFLLAIILLIAAVGLWLRAKLAKLTKGLGGLAEAMSRPVIPQTLELRPGDAAEVGKRPALGRTIKELRDLGFDVGGVFLADGLPDAVAVPFADTARQVAGLVVDTPKPGVVIDFVTAYADGGAMFHTNLPDQGLDSPPQRPKVRMVGAGAAALLERHLAERPDRPRLPVAVADVPPLVKRFTEEEWFWRATRGGATDAELDHQVRQAQADSPQDFDDPKARDVATYMTRALIRGQAASFLQEKLLEQFQRQTTLPVHEWEKVEDRLLFVHEAADVRELGRHVAPAGAGATRAEDDDAESDWMREPPLSPTEKRLEAGPKRQVFAELNSALPAERRLQQIGTVTITSTLASLTADVYVAPPDPEEEDEELDEEDEEA